MKLDTRTLYRKLDEIHSMIDQLTLDIPRPPDPIGEVPQLVHLVNQALDSAASDVLTARVHMRAIHKLQEWSEEEA